MAEASTSRWSEAPLADCKWRRVFEDGFFFSEVYRDGHAYVAKVFVKDSGDVWLPRIFGVATYEGRGARRAALKHAEGEMDAYVEALDELSVDVLSEDVLLDPLSMRYPSKSKLARQRRRQSNPSRVGLCG